MAGNGQEHWSIHCKSRASEGRGRWEVELISDHRDPQMLDFELSSGDFRLSKWSKRQCPLLDLYCLTHSRHPINISWLNYRI